MYKLLRYYWYQISKSITLIISFVSCVLIVLILIPCLNLFLNKSLFYDSYLISIVILCLSLTFGLIIIIKLFVNNKYNFSDIKLISKAYSRSLIIWTKLLIVLIITSVFNFALIIVSFILTIIFNSNQMEIVWALFVSNIFGLIINNFAIFPLFVLFSIIFSRIISTIMSLSLLILLPITSLISNYIIVSQTQNTNFENNTNLDNNEIKFAKIIELNENNAVLNSKYVASVPSTVSYNEFIQSINNVPISTNAMFGNNWMSIQQEIFSSIVNVNNDLLKQYYNYKNSLARFKFYNVEPISKFINSNNKYAVLNSIDDSVISNNTFMSKELIIDAILCVLNDNKFSNIVNDTNNLILIEKEINKSIWNFNQLPNSLSEFVFELLGKSNPVLFYFWFYKDLINFNTDLVYNQISTIFKNKTLNSIIKTLYTNYNTFKNIIDINFESNVNTNNVLEKFKQLIKQKYPINTTINSSDIFASKNNIDFVLNDLVLFEKNIAQTTPIILDQLKLQKIDSVLKTNTLSYIELKNKIILNKKNIFNFLQIYNTDADIIDINYSVVQNTNNLINLSLIISKPWIQNDLDNTDGISIINNVINFFNIPVPNLDLVNNNLGSITININPNSLKQYFINLGSNNLLINELQTKINKDKTKFCNSINTQLTPNDIQNICLINPQNSNKCSLILQIKSNKVFNLQINDPNIEFINNQMMIFKNIDIAIFDNVKILNKNLEYVLVDPFLFKQLICTPNYEIYQKYLCDIKNNSSCTVEHLISVIDKLNKISNNQLYSFQLDNNNFSIYDYDYIFDIEIVPFVNFTWVNIVIQIFSSILLLLSINMIYMKKKIEYA